MPKKNLVLIYEHLFKEGVMVAKKDTHLPKHPEIDVPNLQVMKTLNVSILLDLVNICLYVKRNCWKSPSHFRNIILQTSLRSFLITCTRIFHL